MQKRNNPVPTMEVVPLAIPDLRLIVPKVFCDTRGSFVETYSRRTLAQAGIDAEFVQDNQSHSVPAGTVRGLHFQTAPFAQAKLVRVVAGAVFDVSLDIRVGSPTYGRHVGVEISARNGAQIWVPEGFAHGFCTLEPDTIVIYKTTASYAPECDSGVKWDDPALGIAWPVAAGDATLSDKDRNLSAFSDLAPAFSFR